MFKNIIGQQAIKERLIRSVHEKRIPHAQMLHGPEGVGKLGLAVAYAQYISCKKRSETEACGVCPSCVKYQQLAHPDLHFVFPVIKPPKANTVVCDDFLPKFRETFINSPYFSLHDWYDIIGDGAKRGLIYSNESSEILRKLSLKTYESDFKVMIIWHPELMHETCANKVLKILEEPPANTVFLLVSNNPEENLTTIISRTQQLKVPRLPEEEIVAGLKQNNPTADDTQILNAARIAEGSYLRATKLLNDNTEMKNNYEQFIELMRKAWLVGNRRDYEALRNLKKWSEEMASADVGRERQKKFLIYSQKMLRENYIYNLKQSDLNYLTDYENSFSKNFSPFINETNVEDLMAEFSTAERQIEQNTNSKMVFFDLALKIIMLLKK